MLKSDLRRPAAGPVAAKVMPGLVNWNQKEDTLHCLRLLEAAARVPLEIVVVDNGSTDGSVEAIRQAFPNVHVIANASNRGAAGGRNDLFSYFLKTDADYLMVLDPDVSVPPDFFETLLQEIAQRPQAGCIGVKAYYADRPDTFWMKGGGNYNPWLGRFERTGREEKDRGQYARSEEVASIPAGFTFIQREVIEACPEMDERYFIYFEESDWNFKVRKKGYRLYTSERASVLHKVSSSLGMESPFFYYYRTRNNLLFAFRNSSFFHWPVFLIYFFCYSIPNVLYMLWRSGKPKQFRAVLLGIADFFRGRFYACPHRFN